MNKALYRETLSYALALRAKRYTGTFEEDGQEYSVEALYTWIKEAGIVPRAIHLEDLAGPFEEGESDEEVGTEEWEERAMATDLDLPIILWWKGDTLVLVDGRHRYWKARELGLRTLEAYVLSALPDEAKVTRSEVKRKTQQADWTNVTGVEFQGYSEHMLGNRRIPFGPAVLRVTPPNFPELADEHLDLDEKFDFWLGVTDTMGSVSDVILEAIRNGDTSGTVEGGAADPDDDQLRAYGVDPDDPNDEFDDLPTCPVLIHTQWRLVYGHEDLPTPDVVKRRRRAKG